MLGTFEGDRLVSVRGVMQKPFPFQKLVLPGFLAGCFYFVAYLAESMGHHWNLHGSGVDIAVFMLFILAPCIAAPIQVVGLAIALPRLVKYPEEQIVPNYLATAFAVLCVVIYLFIGTSVLHGSK